LPPGTPAPGAIEDYTGAGGRRLSYRIVAPASAPTRHLLYLHGIESHGAWFLPAAFRLRDQGCVTYLVDRRGSGLNREPDPGDAPSARVLLEDVRLFRRHIGDPELHLIGLSWGGKLASAVAIDEPRGLRSLILVTPGLKSRLDLPVRHRMALLCGLLGGGRNRIPLPIESWMFSRDRAHLDFIRDDPWRLHRVTGRFLLANLRLGRMIACGFRGLRLPVLVFLAGRDRIVDNEGVMKLILSLPAGQARVRTAWDAIHSLQFDEQDLLIEETVAFLNELGGGEG
jgi:alpha-beta hydrolase superfamily lysophospholipase